MKMLLIFCVAVLAVFDTTHAGCSKSGGNKNSGAVACSGKNEHYENCGSSCTVTCDNMNDQPMACSEQCKSGCRCNDGYVRNSDGKCVKTDDCPRAYVPADAAACPGKNEHYENCGSSCTVTCDNVNDQPMACAEQCKSGCRCDDGYVRNSNGKCVKIDDCPRAYVPAGPVGCPGKNEHYENCGSSCTVTCDNVNDQPMACAEQCKSGCRCDDGYVRNSDGKCVKIDDCPRAYQTPDNGGGKGPGRRPGQCPRNQHWDECGNSCIVTCDNYNDSPRACAQQCQPGCKCNDGFVRNGDGKCVNPNQCPRAYDPPASSGGPGWRPGQCPRNQHWDECGNSCVVTCDNYNDPPRACAQQCQPGCKCNDGFVRNGDGKCVDPNQCPRAYDPPAYDTADFTEDQGTGNGCPINQHYESCGTACPDTCDNYNNNTRPCTKECNPGCQCNKGLVLTRDRQCIPPGQCRPQQGGAASPSAGNANVYCGYNQHYEQCGTPCPLTCANYYDPPSACPAYCVSGCQCNEGYIIDPNGNCVQPSQCPGDNNPRCEINERYSNCTSYCPVTCDNINGGAPDSCQTGCKGKGCECANGFVRNRNGRCVRPQDCQYNTCRQSEVYTNCVVPCNDCQNRGNCGRYNCYPGCDCIRGYYRNADKVCVPADQCPNTCKQNEFYSNCVIPCNDCYNRGNCYYYCYPGCDCYRGYYRNANGICVPQNQCPSQ